MNGIEKTQLFGPATLSGAIAKGARQQVVDSGRQVVGKSSLGSNLTTTADNLKPPPPLPTIRPDFAQELQSHLTKGLKEIPLDEQANRELKKLEGAAEGFESHFVKDLLGQMRKTAFSEKDNPTLGLAKDLMDQQLADQTAKSHQGIGIGKMLFGKMGEQVVRQSAGRSTTPSPQ